MTDQPRYRRIKPGELQILVLEQTPTQKKDPGQVHGIYIVVRPDVFNRMVDGFAWTFQGSKVARLISANILDKAGIGLIVIEWIEYEVNPLFLIMLEEESDKFIDYKLYQRKLDQDNETKE